MPPKLKNPQSPSLETSPENHDLENQFESELLWCIRQLELGLCNQNPDSRQAAEAIKVLKILKSDKAPLIKKRQAMRNTFGDYRQKIKEEEKKSAAKMKKVKVKPVNTASQSKSVFYKKSLKTADNSYVAMMASVSVNGVSDQSTVDTHSKQEVPCGFQFGFPTPESCENEAARKESESNVEPSCLSHDMVTCDNSKHVDDLTKFVMTKTDNSFRFNFEIPP